MRTFRAPGRINIIGEHTDYTDGLVMPAAIDRWCVVRAQAKSERRLRLTSSAFDGTIELDLDDLTPAGNWTDYVAGAASALTRAGIPLTGADLEFESNVPVGAGVSSSAAIEVASIHALLALSGQSADGPQIARWAQQAENDFVGMPCGIMDQFASATGVAGSALMLDCRTLQAIPAALPANARFLVVNSMEPHAHAHATGEYAARRADCESVASILRLNSLRDLEESDLSEALPQLDNIQGRRCRHVVTENGRVRRAAVAMQSNDLATLGELINASHASLRDDMQVSIRMVDQLAEIAQQTPGVYGARMMGGGFGGCVIALVEATEAEKAMELVKAEYAQIIGQTPDAFLCNLVEGAGEVIQ